VWLLLKSGLEVEELLEAALDLHDGQARPSLGQDDHLVLYAVKNVGRTLIDHLVAHDGQVEEGSVVIGQLRRLLRLVLSSQKRPQLGNGRGKVTRLLILQKYTI